MQNLEVGTQVFVWKSERSGRWMGATSLPRKVSETVYVVKLVQSTPQQWHVVDLKSLIANDDLAKGFKIYFSARSFRSLQGVYGGITRWINLCKSN